MPNKQIKRNNPNPEWYDQLARIKSRQIGHMRISHGYISEYLGVSESTLALWSPNNPKHLCPDNRQIQIEKLYQEYLNLEVQLDVILKWRKTK